MKKKNYGIKRGSINKEIKYIYQLHLFGTLMFLMKSCKTGIHCTHLLHSGKEYRNALYNVHIYQLSFKDENPAAANSNALEEGKQKLKVNRKQ